MCHLGRRAFSLLQQTLGTVQNNLIAQISGNWHRDMCLIWQIRSRFFNHNHHISANIINTLCCQYVSCFNAAILVDKDHWKRIYNAYKVSPYQLLTNVFFFTFCRIDSVDMICVRESFRVFFCWWFVWHFDTVNIIESITEISFGDDSIIT